VLRVWLRTSRLSDNHIYTYLKIAKSEVTLQNMVLEMPQRIIKICETGYKKSNVRKEGSRKLEIYEAFLKVILERAGTRNRNIRRHSRGQVIISYLKMHVHIQTSDYSSVLVKAYANRFIHMQASVYIHWYELRTYSFL